MTFYVFTYDTENGIGLSTNVVDAADTEVDLMAYSSEGNYAILRLPDAFMSSEYRADFNNLDNNSLPLYIIERFTGHAYDHNGNRASSADIEAEERPEPSDVESYIISRGIILGDEVTLASESGTPQIDLDEDEQETYAEEVASHLSGIASGRHVLVNIGLSAGDTKWPQDVETGKFIRIINNESITTSTVLCVMSVNRQDIRSDIEWETEEGKITFTTSVRPVNDILIRGFLFETGDEWSAKGIIESWPPAMVTKRFCQSLQTNDASAWPISLSARGTEGYTKLISTSADFRNAELLIASPEYTGNPNVIIPQIYVSSESHMLVYRVTNLSDASISIGSSSDSDVILKLCYTGAVSGIIEESSGG